LNSSRSTIDISVIEFSIQNNAIHISASEPYEWADPVDGYDVNVAVGDLNGDQLRNEVVVAYRRSDNIRFQVFAFGELGLSPKGTVNQQTGKAWCSGEADCSIVERDLEISIGKTKHTDQEQLTLLDVAKVRKSGVNYARDQVLIHNFNPVTWALEPVGNCSLIGNFSLVSANAGSPYSSALGMGDMNADGLANIAYTFGNRFAALSFTEPDTCSYKHFSGLPDSARSMALGDIDLDGRSEAIVSSIGASTTTSVLEMVENNAIRRSALHSKSGWYAVLVGDLDNDTRLAQLAGCSTFTEIKVIGVVNSAPRWYDGNGQPIQDAGGVYGRTESDGGGDIDGTTHRYGGSLSIGYEHEFNMPITALKIAEVRGKLTNEIMWQSGTTTSNVTATTQEMGYKYTSTSLGMVVYNSTEFSCYYYDVYPSHQPQNSTRAMLCSPTGRVSAEDFKPIEDWHSSGFKQAAGPAWVDVGHRSPGGVLTNNLEENNNYSRVLPVDKNQVKYLWKGEPIKVSWSSQGGFTNYWHISDMQGGETVDIDRFEHNHTLSLGATLAGITLDIAGTYGRQSDSSSVTTWAKTLEIGGAVAKYTDDKRLCYDIVPYVHHARTVTAAGVDYKYLELDYYVPSDPYPCAREVENAGLITGIDLPVQ
jgi:hypothetical protein